MTQHGLQCECGRTQLFVSNGGDGLRGALTAAEAHGWDVLKVIDTVLIEGRCINCRIYPDPTPEKP